MRLGIESESLFKGKTKENPPFVGSKSLNCTAQLSVVAPFAGVYTFFCWPKSKVGFLLVGSTGGPE